MKRRGYVKLDMEKPTYIREDRFCEVAEVDVTVFDCDGVLLDVRQSYNKAVAETTISIVEAFTGMRLSEELFDGTLNFKYKVTGGFNNDWSHAYAYIMRLLAEAGEGGLREINRVAADSLRYEKPGDRFNFINGKLDVMIPVEGLYEKLGEFASRLDATGIESVDDELLEVVGVKVKEALRFRAGVGESMISTFFEELFLGRGLFTETYGFSPCFVDREQGFVEHEDIVVTESTLNQFEELNGGTRLGVASGSMSNTARHALGEIIKRFPKDSQIWHDIVDEYMRKKGQIGLHKPNEFPLVKASEPYSPFKRVLYIGDTMADYLTAENAGNLFLFAGVYGCVHNTEGAMKAFLDRGSDIVAPTVNDIPEIIKYARMHKDDTLV